MDQTLCKFCSLKSRASETLTLHELETMEHNCTKIQYKKGDKIIIQGEVTTHLAYIKTGLVKVHVKFQGREKIARIVKAPAYLSLPNTFVDKVNSFSATAIDAVNVCFIDLKIFKQFIYDNGEFAYQIIMDMSKGEIKSYYSLLHQTPKQNRGRVADALLFFKNEIYESNSFKLPIGRQEFADLIHIVRESASRILSEFQREKILAIKGTTITILEETTLQQISENGY
ncbi:MAG: Crp/Fnr family transcriptional regulator [Ferruginibacter sp.]